jgi:hypothetical protein
MFMELKLLLSNDIHKKAFKYILENNKSNSAPYHSLMHMLYVTKNLYMACIYYKYDKNLAKNYVSILLAGLFHDMNHSMGKEKDDYNIKQAIKAFNDFYDRNPDPKINKELVENMIYATQYPYVIDEKDLSLEQKIIRDADLLMGKEDNWFDTIFIGLGTEMNVDYKDLAEGNIKFYKNIKWHSEWGEMMAEGLVEDVIEKMNFIKECLK